MSAEEYIAAAMVACPRCGAAIGKPCWVWACRNGYRNCDFAICAYRREVDQPHLERSVKARQAEAASTSGGAA